MPVLFAQKTIECRSWKTDYRGDLLICSSAKKCPATISGKALCIVSLDDITPFTAEHMDGALMDGLEMPDNCYAWHFSNLRWIEPFDVKGKLHLYDVDDELIKIIPETISDVDALKRFYEPLVYWGRNKKEARKIWDDAVSVSFL